jgi:hypothetical protein
MTVTYTAIRSVDGLTQDDLRDTAVSGTLATTFLAVGSVDITSPFQLIDNQATFQTAGVIPGDSVASIAPLGPGATVTLVVNQTTLNIDTDVFPAGVIYVITGDRGDPGLVLLDVVPDGKGFNYIFIEE